MDGGKSAGLGSRSSEPSIAVWSRATTGLNPNADAPKRQNSGGPGGGATSFVQASAGTREDPFDRCRSIEASMCP